MPIVIKSDVNIDRASDGFDPEIPYQMVPFGRTREIAVQTGDFKAEMAFTRPDVSSMSNFRVLQQKTPGPFLLPGPGVFVNRITLAERSIIQFTLSGRGAGVTTLEGRDRPGLGAPLLPPDFRLEISVKLPGTRRFAVCYVFDPVNRDIGRRTAFGRIFREISKLYEEQANFTIINVDGDLSGAEPGARTLTIAGTVGRTFNPDNKRQVGPVINAFDASFAAILPTVDAVVFAMPVPLLVDGQSVLGMQKKVHRLSDGKKFQTIFVGPTERTDEAALRHTLAHEIGHSFGLTHRPATAPPGPRPNVNPDPDILPAFMHNLMFPNNVMRSTRLNGRQIDDIHLFIPPFRNLEI